MFQCSSKKVDFATKKKTFYRQLLMGKTQRTSLHVCPATNGPSTTELLNLKAQRTLQNRST